MNSRKDNQEEQEDMEVGTERLPETILYMELRMNEMHKGRWLYSP